MFDAEYEVSGEEKEGTARKNRRHSVSVEHDRDAALRLCLSRTLCFCFVRLVVYLFPGDNSDCLSGLFVVSCR